MSDQSYQPPVIQHAEWGDGDERLLIFSIEEYNENGEPKRVDYTIDARPNGGVALQYLKMRRTLDADTAAAWLIERAVGTEAYDALASEPDLTGPMIGQIAGKINDSLLGMFSAPKASSNGSRG